MEILQFRKLMWIEHRILVYDSKGMGKKGCKLENKAIKSQNHIPTSKLYWSILLGKPIAEVHREGPQPRWEWGTTIPKKDSKYICACIYRTYILCIYISFTNTFKTNIELLSLVKNDTRVEMWKLFYVFWMKHSQKQTSCTWKRLAGRPSHPIQGSQGHQTSATCITCQLELTHLSTYTLEFIINCASKAAVKITFLMNYQLIYAYIYIDTHT